MYHREKQSADIQLENAQADIQLMALELSAIREENEKLVKVMEEQRQQLETLPEQLAVANETIDKVRIALCAALLLWCGFSAKSINSSLT
jgi:type VI protein secretion system component VasF